MRTRIDYRKIYTEHWQVEIPADFHIHHIDGDSHNNNPINLVALSAQDHHDAHLAMGDVWSARLCLWVKTATEAAHTPEANAKRAAAKTGRTKETCSGTAAQAAKITGRTKETCSGRAAQAAKMTGRLHWRYNPTPYKFHHAEKNWTVICDRQYMRDTFGINPRRLFFKIGADKSTKGWSLLPYGAE